MEKINKVDDFYRKREILEYLNEWTPPLSVYVHEDREVVEIGFHSEVARKITKKEKVEILKIISLDLVSNHGIKDIFEKLEERLKLKLKEMKTEIKKDLGIVKGGDYIEN